MEKMIRLGAVGDLHCDRNSQGKFQPLFAQAAAQVDVLLLCGDLTDYGQPEEAHVLAKEIAQAAKIPILAVLGNHDFESGKQDEVKHILMDAGVMVLDGDSKEVMGVGFAGVKGFGGGFGVRALQPWGEDAFKGFVRGALDETLKLESALARLRTPQRVVLLHYAPIRSTVENEPPEIFPFLGSSRLEEPINRYPVSMVFHGHAHHGALEGQTLSRCRVFNVAMPLLKRLFPDRPPFYIQQIPVGGSNETVPEAEVTGHPA